MAPFFTVITAKPRNVSVILIFSFKNIVMIQTLLLEFMAMPKQTSSEKRPTINYAIMPNQILFRQFKTIIEIMHLALMKHSVFPLIPRNIEALLHDGAMDIEVSL